MDNRIPESIKFLDSFTLKMIAVVSMLIDHSAKALLFNTLFQAPWLRNTELLRQLKEIYPVLRGIGRLAFPIFCFTLVEGFLHTRSRWKYLLRLLVFAAASEVVFDMALYHKVHFPGHQNVLLELALGLVMLWVWETIGYLKGMKPQIRLMLQSLSAACFLYLASFLKLDYGFKGLAIILLIYLLRFYREEQCAAGALIVSIFEWPAVFSFALIALYNGKRGRNLKYFFYAFYPAHLLFLTLISTVLKNHF